MGNQQRKPKPTPARHEFQTFKMQWPLAGAGMVLVYNEDRSIMFQQPVNKQMAAIFEGKLKIFVKARVKGKNEGEFEIDAIVPDPGW